MPFTSRNWDNRLSEYVRLSDRLGTWGVALAGGHWKPVLVVDVAYGGQSRFQQLVQLLEGSGVEIQRSIASP